MRTIPAPELALWEYGDTSVRELRVRMKRPGDAGWTNLSATLGGDWVLGVRTQGDTPDQPAGQFVLTFLKHAPEGSASPGIEASALNTDASLAFRPILHPRRSVEVDARIDAEPWRMWLQGYVTEVEWGGYEVVVTCLTNDGRILTTQIESEIPSGAPDPGTAVEDEIQALLDEWMASPPTLLTVGTPGWGVYSYTPPLGSLGEHVRGLAQRNGWDVRYRWYEADSDYRYTLSLPPRDKTVADFTLDTDLMFEVPGLKVSDQYIRNRFRIRYNDADGVEQTPVVVEDTDSIAEYDVLAMPILELGADSPIRDSTAATALGEFARADLSLPLADGRWRIPFLPWLELHDLLALQADDDHYDYDTEFSIVGISHVVDPVEGWWTEVELRGGKPAGAFYSWHARTPSVPPAPALSPSVAVVASVDQLTGEVTATLQGNGAVRSGKVAVGASAAAAASALTGATPYDGQVILPATLGVLDTLVPEDVLYIAGQGFSEAGGAGEASAIAYDRVAYGVGGGVIPDETIDTNHYVPASVNGAALSAANRAWVADILFTSDDHDTVSWAAGTLTLSDGTTYSTASGATGNMTAQTWIYLDLAVSASALQASTDMSDAVGEGRFMVAYARPIADTDFKALAVPIGGKPSINAENISGIYLSVVQAVVDELSAITADIGLITAGRMENTAGGGSNLRYVSLTTSDYFLYARTGAGVETVRIDHNGNAWFAGELQAASGTFSGTVEATAIVAAEAFTAPNPEFTGAINMTHGAGGIIFGDNGLFLETPDVMEVKSTAGTVRIGTGGRPTELYSSGGVDFHYAADATSRSAESNWLPIKVNGTTKYLRLWS